MSLESSLDALTKAVEANTAAILASQGEAAPAPAKGGRKAKTTPTEQSAPPAAAPPAAPAPAATAATPQPAAAPSVTVKQWTDKFVELGELGDEARKEAIAIMESYGAARASLIPADKYAEAYQRAVAAIEKRKQPAAPVSAASLV